MAPDSQVETFAAVRLEIDSWRWQGVPFYIRAGKCLPVTCTEVLVKFRRPPAVLLLDSPAAELLPVPDQPRRHDRARRRWSWARARRWPGSPVELLASHHADADEMDAYERLLGDAMKGDATPVRPRGLRGGGVAHRRSGPGDRRPPSIEYEPNTWGPSQADRIITGAAVGMTR